jgi:4-diphosphocytidyl-2-C-methyl-D-erythritol kinase
VRPDGAIRRVAAVEKTRDYGVAESDDLAIRAARMLQSESGCALGCEIAVEKRIPLGGGFGGGSSDAATVLQALDQLWKTGLGTDRLVALGLRLGADVPVFVHGHNAWAEGIGERLTPIELSSRWYLIVDPGIHVPTAELFNASDLTRDAAPATITAFSRGPALGNAFEPVLRRREPKIAAALDALAQFGRACVTGSGGGCFVAFDTRGQAESALAALPKGWRAWVAAGASRSPLLDRLEQMH